MSRKREDAGHAVVTGGAGGLGFAIAASLCEAGYRVGLFDRDGALAAEQAARLPRAVGVEVDVTNEDSVAAAMAAFGAPPQVLVNNAGVTGPFGMWQDVADFRRVLDINLVGAFIMAKAVAPAMISRGRGVIINVTSVAGTTADPAGGAYAPSKAALSNLTKGLALHLAPHGIRVNAVCPGIIDAGLGVAADAKVRAARAAMAPQGRLGSADEVADLVAFLASDRACYIQGQEIVVDGALTLSALTPRTQTSPARAADGA